MAQIYPKEFDASKRYDRTVFRGSPNLFTTEDLNFQLKAIRRDIMRSDWTHGAVGSMDISTSYNAGNSKLTVTLGAYGSFVVGGIHTPSSNTEQTLEITVGYNDPVYLFIEGTYAIKTYADDPTHGFVGAKFDDGTSMPAADQRVAENFVYHLARHDDEDPYFDDIYEDIDDRFCFLIAKIVQVDANTAHVYKNFSRNLDTPTMNPRPYLNEVISFDSEKEVLTGDTFEEVIGKLAYKDSLRKSALTSLLSRPYVNEEAFWHTGHDIDWAVRNNNLLIRFHIDYLTDRFLMVMYGSDGDKYDSKVFPINGLRSGAGEQIMLFDSAFVQLITANHCFDFLWDRRSCDYRGYSKSLGKYYEQVFIPISYYRDQESWAILDPQETNLMGEYGLCLQKVSDIDFMDDAATLSAFIGFKSTSKPKIDAETYSGSCHLVDKIPNSVITIPLSF